MASLYYNGQVDTNWSTVGNWWADAAYQTPANRVPNINDDVYLYNSVASNTGSIAAVASLSLVGPVALDITIAVTGTAAFSNGATLSGLVSGNCAFYDSAKLTGTAIGTCYFYGYSDILNGFVSGNCTFYDNAYISSGTIIGNCTVTQSAVLGSVSVVGDCTFTDYGANGSGSITGDCLFYDFANNTGSITGDCTFYSSSSNYSVGSITGNCTFNGSSQTTGLINGNCIFNDNSIVNHGPAWSYLPAWYAYINGNCTFNNYSALYGGLITGNAVFNNYSSHNAYPNIYPPYVIDNGVSGSASFFDDAVLAGYVNGNADFHNNSYTTAYSTVGGNATFNDNSYNGFTGYIGGNAFFYNNSFNLNPIGVTGSATYQGFTGTNSYGTFIGGQRVLTFFFANSGDWDSLGSWVVDNGGGLNTAEFFPRAVDNVTVNTAVSVYSSSGGTKYVNNITFENGVSVNGMDIVAGTSATLNSAFLSGGQITAPNIVLNGTSDTSGNLAGDVTFNDDSRNGGQVSGNATFNGNTYNAGTVTGTATFTQTNFNGLSCGNGGWCTAGSAGGYVFTSATPVNFNLSSSETWEINTTGWVFNTPGQTWTFSGNAVNGNSGVIYGNAIFSNDSYNTGTIVGSVTFNDGSCSTAGTIDATGGTLTFTASSFPTSVMVANGVYDPLYNTTVYGVPTFSSSSQVTFTVFGAYSWYSNTAQWVFTGGLPHWVFNDYSSLTGYVNSSSCTFNHYATLESTGGFDGYGYFYGYSVARGSVIGNVQFSGLAYASYSFTLYNGAAEFYEGAYNAGNINGPATFYGASFSTSSAPYNEGTIFGNATFLGFSYNGNGNGIGYVNGSATFQDIAYNLGTVYTGANFISPSGGSGTGAAAAANYGTVHDNTSFSGYAFNSNTGTLNGGTHQFTAYAYNAGTINGEASFNSQQPECRNTGTINGSAIFYGAASNWRDIYNSQADSPSNPVINGVATFNDYSWNGGRITSTGQPSTLATFNNSSFNAGWVDHAIFNDSAVNYNNQPGVGPEPGRVWGGSATFTAPSYTFDGNGPQYPLGDLTASSVTFSVPLNVQFTLNNGFYWTYNTSSWNFSGPVYWTFTGSSKNVGVLASNAGGSAVFTDSAENLNNGNSNSGYVNVPCTFLSSALNTGQINAGSVTFNDYSYNNTVGSINATYCSFYNWTYNFGSVTGDAAFYDDATHGTPSYSYGSGNVIIGSASFSQRSRLAAAITGTASFTESVYYSSPIASNGSAAAIVFTAPWTSVTFYNPSENWSVNTTGWQFLSGQQPVWFFGANYYIPGWSGSVYDNANTGLLSGTAYFSGYSGNASNNGAIYGTAYFETNGTFNVGMVYGTAYFNNGAYNGHYYTSSGNVDGTAYFTDSYNYGSVNGTASFSGIWSDTGNYGALYGSSANFYGVTRNAGTIWAPAYFYDDSRNYGALYNSIYWDGLTGPFSNYWGGFEAYFIGGQSTSLNEVGTGSWNSVYWITGTQTTLDQYGNGTWNNYDYLSGIIETTLYYDARGNTDWANIGNWWTDAALTQQASFYPRAIDTAIFVKGAYCDQKSDSWAGPATAKSLTLM